MNTDYGSKKPLNWTSPQMAESAEKSVSHYERTEAFFRMGTPPTRRGAFNGSPTPFAPNRFHPELNPALTLDVSKALGTMSVPLRPEDEGMDQGQAQPKVPGQPAVPGMAGMPAGNTQTSIGMTPSGKMIYEDPFHTSHKDFDRADFMAAADQFGKRGDSLSAQALMQMGDDVQSPMERFAARFAGQMPPMSGQPAGGRTLMQGQPQGNLQPGSPPAQLPGQGPAGGGPKPPGPSGPPVGQMSALMGPPPGGPPQPPAASMGAGRGPLGPTGPAMGKPPGSGALGPVGGPPNPGQGPSDIGTGDAKGDPFASLLSKLNAGQMSPDQGKPMMGNPMPDRMGPKPGMQISAPTPGSSTLQQPIGMPGPRNQSAGPLAPASNAGFQGTYINPDPIRTVTSNGMTGSSLGDQMAQQQMMQPMPQQPMYAKAMEQFLKLV